MAATSTTGTNRIQWPSETSSRCLLESFTATYDFELPNYHQLRAMAVGKHVDSPAFTVGGHHWYLSVYPNGKSYEHGDTAAFLCLINPSLEEEVRTKFTLNLLMETEGGAQVQLTDVRPINYAFTRPCYWAGYHDLVEEQGRLGGAGAGGLALRCVLTVMKESPEPEIPGDLARALAADAAKGADVRFLVAGHAFPAHAFLLAARSPVFDRQLFGPMRETDMDRVEVADMDPDVFELLLRFVYTDELPLIIGDEQPVLQPLLVAADRYALEKLKLMCAQELCRSIDVENVTTLLALADQHGCKKLKDACLEFMASADVLGAILENGGFERLTGPCRKRTRRLTRRDDAYRQLKRARRLTRQDDAYRQLKRTRRLTYRRIMD